MALSSAEQAALASLLRWLIAALRGWKRADDPRNSLLVSMFVVANVCDQDGAFWRLLPSECVGNAELIECVSKLIASFAVTYSTRGGVQAPIWEREALDRFKKAEADNDWAAIGDSWRPFEAQLFLNVLQAQAVRCLSRGGLDYLAKAVANVRQTAVAMQFVTALKIEERFDLALTSDNSFIQFASVYVTLSGRWAVRALTPNAVQRLARLLVKVADDVQRWTGWLQVFNAYPVRYPLLQEALGLALASVSESARKTYIDSIVLLPSQVDAPDPGRGYVGVCLQSFRHNATEVQRAALWTVAYERWKQWRFNDRDRNQHLFKINRSQLDYAVVGYATECLTAAELAAEMASLYGELGSIEDNWHVSISDAITEWNRVPVDVSAVSPRPVCKKSPAGTGSRRIGNTGHSIFQGRKSITSLRNLGLSPSRCGHPNLLSVTPPPLTRQTAEPSLHSTRMPWWLFGSSQANRRFSSCDRRVQYGKAADDDNTCGMVRKLPLTDFRAVRSKLEPHEFALSEGQDAAPSNLVEQEVWDGMTCRTMYRSGSPITTARVLNCFLACGPTGLPPWAIPTGRMKCFLACWTPPTAFRAQISTSCMAIIARRFTHSAGVSRSEKPGVRGT
jgi:hypothetical protein